MGDVADKFQAADKLSDIQKKHPSQLVKLVFVEPFSYDFFSPAPNLLAAIIQDHGQIG